MIGGGVYIVSFVLEFYYGVGDNYCCIWFFFLVCEYLEGKGYVLFVFVFLGFNIVLV